MVSSVLMDATAQKETEEVGPKWEKAEELVEKEAEFEALQRMWKSPDRTMKVSTYIAAREQLEAEIDQLRGEKAVALARPAKAPSAEVIKNGWEKLSIERQREVILSVLTAVMVAKGKGYNKGGGIDHSRLTPVFNVRL